MLIGFYSIVLFMCITNTAVNAKCISQKTETDVYFPSRQWFNTYSLWICIVPNGMGVVAPLAQRQVKLIITRSTIQLKSPWQYCSYAHNSPSKKQRISVVSRSKSKLFNYSCSVFVQSRQNGGTQPFFALNSSAIIWPR